MNRFLFLSALFCLCADNTAVVANTSFSQYRLTDLHAPGWNLGYGTAINALGQVVGEANTTGQGLHAFSYDAGLRVDLGTLGGSVSLASGVNDLGQIVGDAETTFIRRNHAFLYSNGVMTDLGTLGGTTSKAKDINNAGQIVGTSPVGSVNRAFLYQNGHMTYLGALSGSSGGSIGEAINSTGMVTGSASIASGGFHAYRYSNGQMTDIGTLGGVSAGYGINDAGQIVGYSSVTTVGDRSFNHAFLYSGGMMMDLGNSIGGNYAEAHGINSLEQIVGHASLAGDVQMHAFLYMAGAMRDLNDLLDASGTGWTLTQANAINDKGWIVANGTFEGGLTHALLLIPVPEPTAAIILFHATVMILLGRRPLLPLRH